MIAHPTPITDPAIERSYRASIAEMTVDLARADERAENAERENATLRRENDALRAQVARLTRNPAPWYLVALAALACLWAAHARAWRRWPYALASLATAALTVAAIVALRWWGGL